MKFQNPSFKISLNRLPHRQTDEPKAICSPLFQSWGHNKAAIWKRAGFHVFNSPFCSINVIYGMVNNATTVSLANTLDSLSVQGAHSLVSIRAVLI